MREDKKIDTVDLTKEILKKGSCVRVPIVGSSMFPLFRKGDVIIIEPVDIEQIVLGDIIVYQREDKIFAHRLVKRYIDNGKTTFMTKGDTFSECDKPFFSEDVLGRVSATERKGQLLRINSGLYGALNSFCAKISPFSRWIYPPLRKIRRMTNRIKNRYADQRPINTLSYKTKD